MNESELNLIVATQEKLDSTLESNSPFVFEELAPPASPDEIEKLRTEFGGIEQPYLEAWFLWHNGGLTHPVCLLPLGGMLSISEAISDRSANQSLPCPDYGRRKRSIKLLDDDCGDGFFLDLSESPPQASYEMMEDPFPTRYGSILQLLQFIERVHAAGIASVNERGVVVFEDLKYQELEDQHLASIGDQ